MKNEENFLLFLSLLNLIFTWFWYSPRFNFIVITSIFVILLVLAFIFYKRIKKGKSKSAWFFLSLGIIFLIASVPLFINILAIRSWFLGMNFFLLGLIWLPFLGITIGVLKQSYDLLKNKKIIIN
ncbi:MAG: hypothetical protein WDK96_03620 [Candidatus Paceibacterota bacterium]|jgi:hypothetical protein